MSLKAHANQATKNTKHRTLEQQALFKLFLHGDLPLLVIFPVCVSKVVQPALSVKVRDGDPGGNKDTRVIDVLKTAKNLRMVRLELGLVHQKGGEVNRLSVLEDKKQLQLTPREV